MKSHELIFPGPGEVKYELPPGSVRIPLQKAPSGHLVMVIDDFEQVKQRRGGLPHASLQLLSHEGGSEGSISRTEPNRNIDFDM